MAMRRNSRAKRRRLLFFSLIALGILSLAYIYPGFLRNIPNEPEKFAGIIPEEHIQQAIENKPVVIPEPEPEIVWKKTWMGLRYRELTMTATGYDNGYQSTGKKPGDKNYGITYSELPADFGAIGVDPDVIPFGTSLWVEGYGFGVAVDKGEAVRGYHVDLWFPTYGQAKEWGVKEVKVRIIEQMEGVENREKVEVKRAGFWL